MALVDEIDAEVGPLDVAGRIDRDKALKSARAEAKSWKDKYEHVAKELDLSEKRNDFAESIRANVGDGDFKTLKPTGESTAVLVLSDWHIEESIDPKTVNGLNEYSLSVAEKRIKRLFERSLMMIEVARGLTKIKSIVVAALGDFITGYIHEELEENNSLSPTEATLCAQDWLVKGIRFLKKKGGFTDLTVVTAFGNHGRTQQKKRISSGYANSFEWLMYHQCARQMKGERGIRWKIENGYHNWLDIHGHQVRFHHGDSLNYGGGVGGITIPVNKAIAQWNKVRVADYDYFGHFHQSINMNRWTCNGSVIGYGPYALSIKAEFEVPSQTISIISSKRGKILTDRVFCD